MSSLTVCNYCTLRNIKRVAQEKGKQVTVIGGGRVVYVHDKDKPYNENDFVAEFMSLTGYCVC